MDNFIQLFISGVLVGVSYAVFAAGLALIFGVLRIINFAHAEFAVLAMYLPAYWFLEWWGIDPFISAAIAFPMFFFIGYLVQWTLVQRVIGKSETSTLIITMGFSLLIANMILIGWSGAPRIINQPYTLATWRIGKILINHAQTYSLLISLVLIIGLLIFLNKSTIGKSIRAAADDAEGCAYMGINVGSVYAIAFGLGIAVTGVGGCLMATYRPFNPFYGESIIIIIFASVVLGGVNSIIGSLIGGLLIGIIQQLSIIVVPISLQNVAVFLLFVLFLYFRPQGFFGKKERVV